MGGGHRPGLDSTVTVAAVNGNTVTFSFEDPEDVEYFTVGGKFVAFFTPIAGDSAGQANPQPESGG